MSDVSMDKLLKKTDSVFKLVTIAAKRAIHLSSGARKLVETDATKPTTIALQEIADAKIGYSKGE